MSTMAAAAAVFPGMTLDDLLWEVPESFLYQAENIFASRNGWICVKPGKSSVSDEFRRRWELTTGRKWSEGET